MSRDADFYVPTGVVPRGEPIAPFSPTVPHVGGIGDVRSTAKGSAARYNSGKPDYSLVPLRILAASFGNPEGRIGGSAVKALDALGWWQETGDVSHLHAALRHLGEEGWAECAHVLEYGKGKYAPWNWAKGFQWSVPLACAVRHLLAIIRGEWDDAESKQPHRGHVFANVVMLLTFQSTFPEGDDRPRTLAPAVR